MNAFDRHDAPNVRSDAIELFAAAVATAVDVDDRGNVLVAYDPTDTNQLWEVAPGGSWRQLTDLAEPVTGRYVPGRRRAVVQVDTGGNENGQLGLIELDGTSPPRWLTQDRDHFHWLMDVCGERVLYLTNRRNGVDVDIVEHDLASGRDRTLHEGNGFVVDARYSPDGRRVAFTRPIEFANSFQLVVLDVAGGELRELTPIADGLIRRPRCSRDTVFCSSNQDREMLAVLAFDRDGIATVVERDDEHDLACWPSPVTDDLLIAVNRDGEVAASVRRPSGERVDVPVPAGGGVAGHLWNEPVWSPSGRHVALTYASPVTPPTPYVVDPTSGAVREVEVPHERAAGSIRPRQTRVTAADGEQIPVDVYASDAADGSVVLALHGGPEWQTTLAWDPLVQALTLQGHTVVVPNIRGSTGYGRRWYSLDDRRLRLDAIGDLGALHDALPDLDVDPNRAALVGASYGGYLVLAGLSLQPDLWSAGVDIVGMSSLVSLLRNTSPYRRRLREREYGSLEHDREFLEQASPLTHVDRIHAPLFVVHGRNDPRVPCSETEQLVDRLRERGVPCELRILDDEGHGMRKRHNVLQVYPEILAFLAARLAAPDP